LWEPSGSFSSFEVLLLRHATPEDAKAIAELYNYYIRHTTFTFEESLVNTQLMGQRIASIKAVNLP
tara:strand:+ start:389 stop:586 length:198 start_codon:yes stop_codon:yes gene_type:complete